MAASDGDIPTACVVNLTNVFGDDADTKRFVTRYLQVTHCDLLFADAAVLIEGPAERILVPHFVRHHDEFQTLSECYITWLEIGGSHAHRLRGLIEKIGLVSMEVLQLFDFADKSPAFAILLKSPPLILRHLNKVVFGKTGIFQQNQIFATLPCFRPAIWCAVYAVKRRGWASHRPKFVLLLKIPDTSPDYRRR
jgi:hypothetical protein